MTDYSANYTDDNDMGWDEENALPDDFYGPGLPRPLTWRILVMPVRPRKVSKGGIVLAESTQDVQRHLNYIGKVVSVGSLAYTDKRISDEEHKPKLGEYVIYGRYSGQVLTYRGVRLIIINDDEILAKVASPDDLKISI